MSIKAPLPEEVARLRRATSPERGGFGSAQSKASLHRGRHEGAKIPSPGGRRGFPELKDTTLKTHAYITSKQNIFGGKPYEKADFLRI